MCGFFVDTLIRNYTKHPLKYGKNQADNLVTVENSFLRILAQIFSRFLLVFSISITTEISIAADIIMKRTHRNISLMYDCREYVIVLPYRQG